jgi:molybdopterin adenylyltransferase
VVSDDRNGIEAFLRAAADAGDVDVILTTGGTGVSPRDTTPEATTAVCERLVPGFAEQMRAEGLKKNHRATLSRAAAGIRAKTFIINLPGSPRGSVESLDSSFGRWPTILVEFRTNWALWERSVRSPSGTSRTISPRFVFRAAVSIRGLCLLY